MNDFYCKNILNNKVEFQKIKETENILAFYHTKPSFTFHAVVIPKKHIVTILEADDDLLNEIFKAIKEIIIENKLDQKNYRIVNNGGSFQDSKHLHFHILSGEKLIEVVK